MYRAGRMGAGGLGRRVHELAPKRRGELAARRVGGANEEHRPGCEVTPRHQPGKGIAAQVQVPAAAVTTRTGTRDQARALEHVEMMREEIRCDSDALVEFHGGQVRHRELVDDRQPHRIAQGCVACRPRLD